MTCTQETRKNLDPHPDFKAAYWVLPPIESNDHLDLYNRENLDLLDMHPDCKAAY